MTNQKPRDSQPVQREELLPLVNNLDPKKVGSWVMFHCPVPSHGKGAGDKDRSAGISDNGFMGCFGGCDFKALIETLRERSGVRPGASGARPDTKKKLDENAWIDVETYDYRDADGTQIAIKLRREQPDPESSKGYSKDFRWKLPNAKAWDGFHGKLKAADVPLWGAETISKASPGLRVWFTEGEKACKALRSVGEIATCAGGGGSQREFSEGVLDVLAGRTVVIFPDNDKTGKDYAREIRKLLRGIAKSVAIVSAPVGPGEDAFEYIHRDHGTVEDLLAGVLTDISIEVHGYDHFTIRIPVDSAIVAFDFEDMKMVKRDELKTNMTVTVTGPGQEAEPYNQEINLKSQSTRQGLVTLLKGQFGTDIGNWTTFVSTGYARAVKAWEDSDRVVQVMDLPDVGSQKFVVDKYVPEKAPMLIFGKGGSLKSYFVALLVLHMSLGEEFVGGLYVKPQNILIVDFEDPASWQERFVRLLKGMGLGGYDEREFLRQLPIKFWAADRGSSLESQRDALRRAIKRHEIDTIVIDSAMPACGGKPEDSDVSLAFFNTIHSLDVTSVIISHVGHGEFDAGMRRPYGNVLWENQPRRIFAVIRNDDNDSDDIDIMLNNTKVNRGKKAQPMGYRFHFEDDEHEGPITVDSITNVKEVYEFASKLSTSDQIRAALARSKEPLTLGEIADELGMPRSKIGALRAQVHRMKSQIINLDAGVAGRGNKARYALMVAGQPPPVAPQQGLEGMNIAPTNAKTRSHAHA